MEQLVIGIIKHKVWGTIFAPFMVCREVDRPLLKVLYRLNYVDYLAVKADFSEDQQEMLEQIYWYEDQRIMKIYSKHTVLKDFFATVKPVLVNDVIVPEIQKRLVKCIRLIKKTQTKVYNRNSDKVFAESDKVQIASSPDFAFKIVKTDDSSLYQLHLINNGVSVDLFGKEITVLSENPAMVLVDEYLYLLEDLNAKKLLPFCQKPFIEIAKTQELEWYKRFVAKILTNHRVIAEGFNVEYIQQNPKAIIRVNHDLEGKAVLELCFKYQNKTKVISDDEANNHVVFNEEDHSFKVYLRKAEYESELVKVLKVSGLRTFNDVLFYSDSDKNQNDSSFGYFSICEILGQLKENLENLGVEIEDFINKQLYLCKAEISLKISQKIDWFDVSAIVRFGEFEVPFIKLKPYILHDNREFVLPDGRIAIIPLEWFSRFHDLFLYGVKKGDGLTLSSIHFDLLNLHESQTKGINLNRFHQLRKPVQIKDFIIPETVNAELRPYQLKGIAWLWRLKEMGFSACLADDMGLGKTLQALVFAEKLNLEYRKENPVIQNKKQLDLFIENKPTQEVILKTDFQDVDLACLIVVPTSLLYNWANEIKRFLPESKVLIYSGMNRSAQVESFSGADFIITTYGLIRNDFDIFQQHKFLLIVADEAQQIKNPEAKTYRAMHDLKAKYRLALSGTPLENSLKDLWAQLNFLNRGLLGNYRVFKQTYQDPIEKKNILSVQEQLQHKIQPFILRRTKQEVAKDLPPLIEQTIYCEMGEWQAREYESLKSKIRNLLMDNGLNGSEKNVQRMHVLKGLMQLRLLANHPSLLFHDRLEESGKFSEVINSVENALANNHKVLIYSSFVKHLELFADHFKQNGYKYSMLTGATQNRQNLVDDFQKSEECKLFLISLKAGGIGLNITAGDYVFLLDPWWNVAAEIQAISRAHRIGRAGKVISYRFITRNTIEEKIQVLQAKKSHLADVFVNKANTITFEELETLI